MSTPTRAERWSAALGENVREERGVLVVVEAFGPLVVTCRKNGIETGPALPDMIEYATIERTGARMWRMSWQGRELDLVLRGSLAWAEWAAEHG